MKVYYKATNVDGRDFRTNTVDYAAALASGERVDVGAYGRRMVAECCGPSVLHASVVPTETLIGSSWPCRLFEVTGRPVASKEHKRGFRSLRVVREIDATLALGPQGAQLRDLIGQAGKVSVSEAGRLGAAWDAARGAARDAALDAARDAALDAVRGAARGAALDAVRGAARGAAWGAAWGAARGAAAALVVRDLIDDARYPFSQEHYDRLSGPWRSVLGKIHPDDADL